MLWDLKNKYFQQLDVQTTELPTKDEYDNFKAKLSLLIEVDLNQNLNRKSSSLY